MSWIGNVVAAVGSFQIGKSNQEIYNRQAALNRDKAKVRQAVYEKLDKPRILKQQQREYSSFFVNLLNSGVEFRADTTTFFAAQAFKLEQATDLAIADYNQSSSQLDFENQSILLEAKGRQEYAKGLLTAASEGAKAAGKMRSNYKETGSILG